MNVMSQASSYW